MDDLTIHNWIGNIINCIFDWFHNRKEVRTILIKHPYEDDKSWVRMKVKHKNQIWLIWILGEPFVMEMKEDGTFINKQKGTRGYGKPWTDYIWIEDDGRECRDGINFW